MKITRFATQHVHTFSFDNFTMDLIKEILLLSFHVIVKNELTRLFSLSAS